MESFLLTARPVTLDLLLGRSLAFCVHPSAAWRRLPRSGRLLLAGAYFSASYLTVLTVLFII
jgi:hypothetical protein